MAVTRHRVSVTMSARDKTRRRIARHMAGGVSLQKASEALARAGQSGVSAQQVTDNLRTYRKKRHNTTNTNTGRPNSMAEAAARCLQLQVTHPEYPPHMQMVRKQTKRQQKRSARSKR